MADTLTDTRIDASTRDDADAAVRSPELRRGGRRMVISATMRAGWWIPIGTVASLVWVGAKILMPLAARVRDRHGVRSLRQQRDREVVRDHPGARGVRGRGRRLPVVLRVLRRAPHRARAAVTVVRTPPGAALRLPRPFPDREPDGAGEPRPAPDQPADGVRAGLRGERGDGRGDPGGAVHHQREAHTAVADQLPVARGGRRVVPAPARTGGDAVAGAARRRVGGGGGRRRRDPRASRDSAPSRCRRIASTTGPSRCAAKRSRWGACARPSTRCSTCCRWLRW